MISNSVGGKNMVASKLCWFSSYMEQRFIKVVRDCTPRMPLRSLLALLLAPARTKGRQTETDAQTDQRHTD